MRLEVGGLREPLTAEVEGTVIGPVTRVYSYVGTEVEVEGEPLATPFK